MKKIFVSILILLTAFSLFADINSATQAFDSGNYKMAYKQLLPLAEAGNAAAQNKLGTLYSDGHGIKLNYKKAIYWYQKAINQGYFRAYNNLGYLYQYGQGVKQNYEKAADLYKRADGKGSVIAGYNLSMLYYDGTGVKKDSKKAFILLKKAAEGNFTHAQLVLGQQYYNGSYGTTKNYSEALYWAKRAAELGDSNAEQWLGLLYYHGIGSPQDMVKAFKWLFISANKGNVKAAQGLKILNDKLSKEDISKAKKEAKDWLSTHKNITKKLDGGENLYHSDV